MKTLYRSILFISLFLLLGAPNIYFDILVPAVVDLPSNIEKVALIDRSLSESDVVNVLEKGLISTLSGKKDRFSKSCLDGLYDQFISNGKVAAVKTDIIEKRRGTALDLPTPLEWFEIENICAKYNVDAIVSLEIFSRQYVENVAEVKVGFRIYDPSRKQIIDEFQYYHGIGKQAPTQGDPGSLILTAVNNDDAMKQASYVAGTIYAKRVSPFWIRVKRDYYKRSKRDPKMAEGARMMEVNDWDAAIAAFQLAIEHGHPKTKGRAANNLAIVYEITGNLDLALETAQDAWGKYRNKTAREYVGILKQRQYEMNMLRIQEEN